ncbi:hypothetical protein NDU88_003043 [Pleurodeles waltl]|uniref:Uncharacterized protein n=1 Tax=Pleurodeles waltl TaxID=8319 RepID=A0AAV7W4W0_PLEWA|nr:hypothetical protein NDU88_003043 [Pleurodeles waltl]
MPSSASIAAPLLARRLRLGRSLRLTQKPQVYEPLGGETHVGSILGTPYGFIFVHLLTLCVPLMHLIKDFDELAGSAGYVSSKENLDVKTYIN